MHAPQSNVDEIFRWSAGDGPIVATAIHDGHAVRPEVAALLALDEAERLREEDPFTARWTDVGDSRVVGLRSRFEVDLNRPREQAVYLRPEDAWGLHCWKSPPLHADVVNRSLAEYDAFYARARRELDRLRSRHGRFVVLDIHSYNHRRAGAGVAFDDPAKNPEVNIGTGTMRDRDRWAPVLDRFIRDLRAFDFRVSPSRHLDVRENVKFKGGYFPKWIHETYPDGGCALAVEFKKFFMDEWTGQPDERAIAAIGEALRSTIPDLREELARLGR
jgi:hypothetical protein